MDAVARQDIRNTILVLAYSQQDHINTPYSKTDTRTALHIAAALGNLVLVQLLLWVCTLRTSMHTRCFHFCLATPPSSRQHLSSGDNMEDEGEECQNWSVHIHRYTHMSSSCK